MSTSVSCMHYCLLFSESPCHVLTQTNNSDQKETKQKHRRRWTECFICTAQRTSEMSECSVHCLMLKFAMLTASRVLVCREMPPTDNLAEVKTLLRSNTSLLLPAQAYDLFHKCQESAIYKVFSIKVL